MLSSAARGPASGVSELATRARRVGGGLALLSQGAAGLVRCVRVTRDGRGHREKIVVACLPACALCDRDNARGRCRQKKRGGRRAKNGPALHGCGRLGRLRVVGADRAAADVRRGWVAARNAITALPQGRSRHSESSLVRFGHARRAYLKRFLGRTVLCTRRLVARR